MKAYWQVSQKSKKLLCEKKKKKKENKLNLSCEFLQILLLIICLILTKNEKKNYIQAKTDVTVYA